MRHETDINRLFGLSLLCGKQTAGGFRLRAAGGLLPSRTSLCVSLTSCLTPPPPPPPNPLSPTACHEPNVSLSLMPAFLTGLQPRFLGKRALSNRRRKVSTTQARTSQRFTSCTRLKKDTAGLSLSPSVSALACTLASCSCRSRLSRHDICLLNALDL